MFAKTHVSVLSRCYAANFAHVCSDSIRVTIRIRNLVKYQNGYNLASKMIQTLTEIYDRLILETGV